MWLLLLGNYEYDTYDELVSQVVVSLGYDPEEVTIVWGRDGHYLAYKDRIEDHIYISSNGTVSNRVKVRDEEGKVVSIPFEAKNELDKAIRFPHQKARTEANSTTKSSNSTESKEPDDR